MVKKENLIIVPDEILMNKIYMIRNQKVILDRDLAGLYGVKSIRLREQVKRNFTKFPSHFMFQLHDIEVEILVSQNAIPTKSHLGGTLPYVFTEHGVLMLANVLKSEQAIQVSIRVIELFVKLRETILSNSELRYEVEKIKKKLDNQDKNMEIVFRYLDELIEKKQDPKPRQAIGYRLPKKK